MGTFDKDYFKPRYVDFGKVFLRSERGALEYSTLDRSDNEIALATKDLYLKEVATFDKNRSGITLPIRADLGKVSIALIQWTSTEFILIQSQRRYENEFVPSGVQPLTNRAFNQARFIHLTTKMIKSLLGTQNISLYSSLVCHDSGSGDSEKLKDYVEPIRGKIAEWTDISFKNILETVKNTNILTQLLNCLYAVYSRIDINNNVESLRVAAIISNMSVIEKIHLIESIQHWFFPVLGVFTFAIDYITDYPVTFYILDKPYTNGPPSKVLPLDLSRAFAFNYYDAVNQLSPDELQHETLSYYLKRGLDPYVGVALFKLIETDYRFETNEELELIRGYGHEISPQHWKPLIDRRFSSEHKTIILLGIMPLKHLHIVLKLMLIHTERKLSLYASYHLAAVARVSAEDKDYAKSFRVLLRDAIRNSPTSNLSQIFQHLEIQMLKELILADFEFRNEKKPTSKGETLTFAQEIPDGLKRKSITQTVLSLIDDNLFENLIAILPSNFQEILIDEILLDIEYGLRSWTLTKKMSFWSSIHKKSPTHFINILKSVLMSSDPEQIEHIRTCKEFKMFLISGSNTLYKANTSHRSSSHFLGRTRPSILTLLKDEEIGSLLRTASLQICLQNPRETAEFTAWWLLSELAFANFATLCEDYSKILDSYQSLTGLEYNAIPPEASFLLSGGRSSKELSLCDVCKQFDNDLPLNIINEELVRCTLHVWQEKHILIRKTDISYFIGKLPDGTANATLAKIVSHADKVQQIEIQELDAETALFWLKNTEKDLRASYLLSKTDQLFNVLSLLKHPSHPSNGFLRYLIIDESSTYPSSGVWKDYVDSVAQLSKIHKKSVTADRFLVDYLDLVQGFTDLSKNGAKNRKFLKWIAEASARPSNQNNDIPENILKALLLYETTESAKLIQERVRGLLNQYVIQEEFIDKISILKDRTFYALRKYILPTSLGEHSKRIDELFSKEMQHRPRYNDSRRF